MNSQREMESQVDIGAFDNERKDDVKIGANERYVPCRICQEMFNRIRLTQLYCYECKRAVCNGEHGQWFVKGNHVLCVRCRQAV